MRSTDSRKPYYRRPAGQGVIALFGLVVGLVLMGLQIWLLTLAFDLYLSGDRNGTLLTAVFSGLVFLGGLLMLWIVNREHDVRG